jgi:hypothetical protein
MLFSLRIKDSLLLSLVIILVLTSNIQSRDESPMLQLPQSIVAAKPERELMCLLNVMRQFDYKRTATDLPALDRLNKYLTPGLDRPIDLNTLLLQFYNLKDIDDKEMGIKFEPRKMIDECKLNLEPALKRCATAYKSQLKCSQVVYGPGELNKAPFVTPDCPEGYQRFGSSKCLRKCTYADSIEPDAEAGESPDSPWTMSNYCTKKPTIVSDVKKMSGDSKQRVGGNMGDYEMLEETEGEYIYVQNCPQDYKRVGNRSCIAKCPLGWPDMGNKCLKKGEMIFFPFVWTPGDGNMEGGDKGGSSSSATPAKRTAATV